MKKHTNFEGHKRHVNRKERRLRVVGIEYVPTPGADERLSHAIAILLRAAKNATTSEEGVDAKNEAPSGQAPAVDTPTGSEGDSCE